VSVAATVGVLVAAPVVVGIVVGIVMRPHKPWRDVLEVAAAGSGVLIAVFFVLIIVVLLIEPTTCEHGQCHDNDNQAGAQAVFGALLALILYPFVLVGALVGKLLGRAVRHA
jgi:hypothetical protein